LNALQRDDVTNTNAVKFAGHNNYHFPSERMRPALDRPAATEHSEFARTYVDATAAALVSTGLNDIRDLMASQCDTLEQLVQHLSNQQANSGYGPGKWSLKESIVHMSDTERVFSYRAMRVARGDKTSLPGFEQDEFVPESRANNRSLGDILAEFRAVRGATLALVNSLDGAALDQVGIASGNPVSARALCWIIAGHAAHHVGLTRDRYVPALEAMA
jgi:hypothetical protein